MILEFVSQLSGGYKRTGPFHRLRRTKTVHSSSTPAPSSSPLKVKPVLRQPAQHLAQPHTTMMLPCAHRDDGPEALLHLRGTIGADHRGGKVALRDVEVRAREASQQQRPGWGTTTVGGVPWQPLLHRCAQHGGKRGPPRLPPRPHPSSPTSLWRSSAAASAATPRWPRLGVPDTCPTSASSPPTPSTGVSTVPSPRSRTKPDAVGTLFHAARTSFTQLFDSFCMYIDIILFKNLSFFLLFSITI